MKQSVNQNSYKKACVKCYCNIANAKNLDNVKNELGLLSLVLGITRKEIQAENDSRPEEWVKCPCCNGLGYIN